MPEVMRVIGRVVNEIRTTSEGLKAEVQDEINKLGGEPRGTNAAEHRAETLSTVARPQPTAYPFVWEASSVAGPDTSAEPSPQPDKAESGASASSKPNGVSPGITEVLSGEATAIIPEVL
jgi:uncharacterized membrane protein